MGRRAEIKHLPSVTKLNELFIYDAKTGELRWLSIPKSFKRAKVGDLVGTVGAKHGYRVVGIAGKYYYVHRIIWKMVTDSEPSHQIDHADGDRLNNRFSNLREATNAQNRWNSRLAKNNSSGVKGVCWESGRNTWVATVNCKRIGRFKSKQDAILARMNAAAEMHGEFVRVS